MQRYRFSLRDRDHRLVIRKFEVFKTDREARKYAINHGYNYIVDEKRNSVSLYSGYHVPTIKLTFQKKAIICL
jgi:hypothetical protein